MRPGSETHEARKALFQLGIRRGHLSLDEIERALPPGSLSPAERWLTAPAGDGQRRGERS